MNASNFNLGTTVATHGAIDLANGNKEVLGSFLARHASCDFGDLCEDDINVNLHAILHGGRILSSYSLNSTKVYVITEHDRSCTTILLASEY